ncbi:MAG: D-amino acid aminotransferase [Gammaproteobacteria bacterium]|nr:D-amino acid aminotransferase [Gammaproteobacteria bacterium]
MAQIFLNDRFLPADQACISPLDRGFVFGDGVYEVIPAYGGRLFRLEEHLRRLTDSLTAIRMTAPFAADRWQQILNELLHRNGGGDQAVYLQITRGVAPRDHLIPAGIPPTIFAMSNPIKPVAEQLRAQGISAVVLDDIRWQYCHIKAITLLPNVLLRQQALELGADEALLMRDGLITEGTACNVFIVKDGQLLTPPKSQWLLPGITRDLILELAQTHDIPHRQCDIASSDLRTADEIWVTSSTREIVAVTRLDNQTVGNGQPSPLYHRMSMIFQDYKQACRDGRAS